MLRLSTAGERSEGEQKCMCFLAILFVSNGNPPKEKWRHVKRRHVNWTTTWTKMEAFESIWRCNYCISYKEIVGDFPASHVYYCNELFVKDAELILSRCLGLDSGGANKLETKKALEESGEPGSEGYWDVPDCWWKEIWREKPGDMVNIPLFTGFWAHKRWLFGISEPSTVSVHFFCFPRILNTRQTPRICLISTENPLCDVQRNGEV